MFTSGDLCFYWDFFSQMAKVVNFKMNQDEDTNANKSLVEKSVHNADEDSADIPDAAKETDTSQQEKTHEDHRGVISNKSTLVSVSWHLQPKHQHTNPVYFSDYSRPMTRPPSHN